MQYYVYQDGSNRMYIKVMCHRLHAAYLGRKDMMDSTRPPQILEVHHWDIWPNYTQHQYIYLHTLITNMGYNYDNKLTLVHALLFRMEIIVISSASTISKGPAC